MYKLSQNNFVQRFSIAYIRWLHNIARSAYSQRIWERNFVKSPNRLSAVSWCIL